jgi:hypothetical protein
MGIDNQLNKEQPKTIAQDIESIEFPIENINVGDTKEWPIFLEGLKEKAKKLKTLEESCSLSAADDQVTRWPEGVRRYLLDALNALVIPQKLTEEEKFHFIDVLNKYHSALAKWKEDLLDREHYKRFGEKREERDTIL